MSRIRTRLGLGHFTLLFDFFAQMVSLLSSFSSSSLNSDSVLVSVVVVVISGIVVAAEVPVAVPASSSAAGGDSCGILLGAVLDPVAIVPSSAIVNNFEVLDVALPPLCLFPEKNSNFARKR